MLSRRKFVAITGGALVMSQMAWSEEDRPGLDHILLGASDLDDGITRVEQATGVRAVIGGVHPGRGTRNALLSLGTRRYLEIIAPDPEQKAIASFAEPLWEQLKVLKQPRLITWAAHVKDMDAFVKRTKLKGEIHPGARKRPDGRELSWKTFNLEDNWKGVLPFFIEWSATSVHPSVDAPQGCRLDNFSLGHANAVGLARFLRDTGLDREVGVAQVAGMHAKITGPKGSLAFEG